VYLLLFRDKWLQPGIEVFAVILLLITGLMSYFSGSSGVKKKYHLIFILFWSLLVISFFAEFQSINICFLLFIFFVYYYGSVVYGFAYRFNNGIITAVVVCAATIICWMGWAGVLVNLNQSAVMMKLSDPLTYVVWFIKNLFSIDFLIRKFGLPVATGIYIVKFGIIGCFLSLSVKLVFVRVLRLNRYLYLKGFALAMLTVIVIFGYGYIEKNKLLTHLKNVYLSVNLENVVNKIKQKKVNPAVIPDNVKVGLYKISGNKLVPVMMIPRQAYFNDNPLYYKHDKFIGMRRNFNSRECLTVECARLMKRGIKYQELFPGTGIGIYKDTFFIVQTDESYPEAFMQKFDTVLNGIIEKVLIVAAVMVPLILIFFIARVLLPILKLKTATRKVKLGDYDVTVPVESVDELGQLSESFNDMVSGLKMRELIKYTFGRYVSHEVAKKVLEDPASLNMMTERRDISVLFADICEFTPFTETHQPEEVTRLLNEYFELMVQTVFEYEGTVDKFIGDCIMVEFSTPISQPDHADRAVKCALGMKKAVEQLNELRCSRGQEPIEIAIGINSGEAMVGNVGSIRRMEFSVIGDCVNLASRLEGLAGKGQILISETTYNRVKEIVDVKELPEQIVKGKVNPVKIYELISLK
jgi:class 3 adenylate cyclase